MAPGATCPFLDLPVELRLEIYSYAVLDCRAITVGTARLDGPHHDIIHRLYGNKRSPFPGIPKDHEPVIETRYEASLLSSTHPATIPLTPATVDPPDESYEHTQTAYHTLQLLCKQVNSELTSHFAIPARRQTSLFVQYPSGLHVLHTLTPQLVRQSRSVHIAGTYVPRTYCPPRRACLGAGMAPPQEKLQGDVVPDSKGQLDSLIRSLCGPNPTHPVEKLEMRMYYPGEDSYSTVWGDDSSPLVIALRNVAYGEVSIELWRGRYGTGVYMAAKPTGDRRRTVSTVWRKLEEGRHGRPPCGSWIVDPNWPEWNTTYEMSEGPQGDLIISEPVH
ncbi:hypothetical protein PRZ48_003954 [Zasmidium cellare]|uniref:F-box domain-containing protein n=1 Tax=Zasmidium cellare TaxID=395010 RepID=A0ABR0EWH5_ZASCE|nr:hypothetical protein PRZ48_003954 [Zasmidium cellare]